MSTPAELRARAAELESRVPPVTAGPRTDDERMWLEKAASLRAEASQLETDAFINHMAAQDPEQLEMDRAEAWGLAATDRRAEVLPDLGRLEQHLASIRAQAGDANLTPAQREKLEQVIPKIEAQIAEVRATQSADRDDEK